ncbi:MAG: lysylphosphatidylglycerol synthase transmembrane domain-containing protein [Haloferacaceae archaeon]
MKGSRRNLLWLLLATAILGGLVYVSDYREIVAVLSRAEKGYVAMAIASGGFTLLMWAVVWHRFFGLFGVDARFRLTFRLLLAGTFLNSVTPLGRFGGEPVVAYLIAHRTDANLQQALSSVSSADLSNALPFLTIGAVAVAYVAVFGTLGGIVSDIAAGVVVVVALAGLTIYLLWFGGAQRVGGLLEGLVTLEGRFGRFQTYVDSGVDRGREILWRMREVGENPRQTAVTLLISHLAVVGHVGATYFVLLSLGVDPVLETILVVVALSAFLTFSPTPGSAGTFEAGFAGLVLAFFPVTAATATSVAILYRVGTYLPGVVLGYASLLSLGESGRDEPPP